MLFVCSEAVESKLVKLLTSHTVILPPNDECSLPGLSNRYYYLCVKTLLWKHYLTSHLCLYLKYPTSIRTHDPAITSLLS